MRLMHRPSVAALALCAGLAGSSVGAQEARVPVGAGREDQAPRRGAASPPAPVRAGGQARQAPRVSTPVPEAHWPDNGRSRSPFLRGLDHDTPSLTSRPEEDLFRARPDTYAPPQGDRSALPSGDGRPARAPRRPRGNSAGVGYAGLPLLGWPGPLAGGLVTLAAPPLPAEGLLRLRVTPRSAEVYVDGAYAGTVDDFGGTSDRPLPAGTHRIELQARGFVPVTVDVRVPDDGTVVYRRELEPVSERPGVAATGAVDPIAPPPPPKTLYVVPGCYAGDTPPQPGQLPARCNLADLRVIR